MFNAAAARAKFPSLYDQSMNVLVVQEVARYNSLLSVVHSGLAALELAVQGKAASTAETDALLASILRNAVPTSWKQRAFPSLKPLSSWIEDLKQRTGVLQSWLTAGTRPSPLWLSGLFFPQAFLTAAKQDYARTCGYSIDQVELKAEVGRPGQLTDESGSLNVQ